MKEVESLKRELSIKNQQLAKFEKEIVQLKSNELKLNQKIELQASIIEKCHQVQENLQIIDLQEQTNQAISNRKFMEIKNIEPHFRLKDG